MQEMINNTLNYMKTIGGKGHILRFKWKTKLPEIIFGSSDSNRSKEIIRLQRKNLVRKLIPRVYTSNLIDSDEVIVKRNLWIILGHLYPGAILSHRSALEGGPTSDGHIFLTYKYKKIIN